VTRSADAAAVGWAHMLQGSTWSLSIHKPPQGFWSGLGSCVSLWKQASERIELHTNNSGCMQADLQLPFVLQHAQGITVYSIHS